MPDAAMFPADAKVAWYYEGYGPIKRMNVVKVTAKQVIVTFGGVGSPYPWHKRRDDKMLHATLEGAKGAAVALERDKIASLQSQIERCEVQIERIQAQTEGEDTHA